MRKSLVLAGLGVLALAGCLADPGDTSTETPADGPTAPAGARSMQIAGRAAIFGFMGGHGDGSDRAQLRFWMNGLAESFTELTGINDRQLVGDFLKNGHDQVLFLNYWGGARRWALADFDVQGPLGGTVVNPTFSEPWGASPLLNGWDDEEDLALVGDFLGEGFAQVMLINRDNPGTDPAARAATGRLVILDFRSGHPQIRYLLTWAQWNDETFLGPEDVQLVGDFLNLGHDQLLAFNMMQVPTNTHLAVMDFHPGSPFGPYGASLQNLPELTTWNDLADARYAGDFLGRGHDQLLFINRQYGSGTARIVDLAYADPQRRVPYTEASALLNGWTGDEDRAYVGDFTGRGHDQLLLMNRDHVNGRTMILDYAGNPSTPTLRYRESWGVSDLLDGWQDDGDVLLAGRFAATANAGILAFNDPGVSFDRRVVGSPAQLEDTLRSHFTGDVVVPRGAYFDMHSSHDIPVRRGVHLLGERGDRGYRPLLFTDLAHVPCDYDNSQDCPYSMFVVSGSDASIEGIHLRGGEGDVRDSGYFNTGIAIMQDPVRRRGRNIVIADNELDQWAGQAVMVDSGLRADFTRPDNDPEHPSVPLASDYHAGRPRIGPEDPFMARIGRNYIHNNARNNSGYGIQGAAFLAEGNVFDRNRHAISMGGGAYIGYLARRNYVLEGGFTESSFWGSYWNQHFDVHGTGDADGNGYIDYVNDWYGGLAGEYIDISYNTFRGEQGYGLGKTRSAFELRGKPQIGAYFHDNVLVHDDLDAAVALKSKKTASGIGEHHSEFNFSAEPGNTIATDHSTEIAVGDFDGDFFDDVFVATGTGWFYSSGATEGWRFLHATYLTAPGLAFANVDGDSRTDVIWQDPMGYLVYSSAGTGAPQILTYSWMPLAELRFYDMTGDGKTDIFGTTGGRWYIFDGATHVWSNPGGAAEPIEQLRFGRIDGRAGVDVLAVIDGRLVYSSSGTGLWTVVANSPVTSLANAVVGNFDDDNTLDDIAWLSSSANEWRYSSAGRPPSRTLIPTSTLAGYLAINVAQARWGDFDRNGKLDALQFQVTNILPDGSSSILPVFGQRFMLWMNQQGTDGWPRLAPRLSEHPMR